MFPLQGFFEKNARLPKAKSDQHLSRKGLALLCHWLWHLSCHPGSHTPSCFGSGYCLQSESPMPLQFYHVGWQPGFAGLGCKTLARLKLMMMDSHQMLPHRAAVTSNIRRTPSHGVVPDDD